MLDYELTGNLIAGPNSLAVGAGHWMARPRIHHRTARMPSGQAAITVITHALVR